MPGLARGGAAELSALTLALDAARGLMAVHARGIVHGDVSSSNVLLQRCEAVHPPAWAAASAGQGATAMTNGGAADSHSGRTVGYGRGATDEIVMVGIAQKHAAAAYAASSSVPGSARPSNCGAPAAGNNMRASDCGWAASPSLVPAPTSGSATPQPHSTSLRASGSGARGGAASDTSAFVAPVAAAVEAVAAQLDSCRVLAGRWRPPLVAKVADFGLSCRLRNASQTHVSGATQVRARVLAWEAGNEAAGVGHTGTAAVDCSCCGIGLASSSICWSAVALRRSCISLSWSCAMVDDSFALMLSCAGHALLPSAGAGVFGPRRQGSRWWVQSSEPCVLRASANA